MKESKILMTISSIVLRAGLGLGTVYFINIYLDSYGIATKVGMNIATAIISATLGVPGVGLLYGITFYQIL